MKTYGSFNISDRALQIMSEIDEYLSNGNLNKLSWTKLYYYLIKLKQERRKLYQLEQTYPSQYGLISQKFIRLEDKLVGYINKTTELLNKITDNNKDKKTISFSDLTNKINKSINHHS